MNRFSSTRHPNFQANNLHVHHLHTFGHRYLLLAFRLSICFQFFFHLSKLLLNSFHLLKRLLCLVACTKAFQLRFQLNLLPFQSKTDEMKPISSLLAGVQLTVNSSSTSASGTLFSVAGGEDCVALDSPLKERLY